MNKKKLVLIIAVFLSVGAFGVTRYIATDHPAAIPGDLRDAPDPGAFSELSSSEGKGPDVPIPSPLVSKTGNADTRGKGKWIGWLQGREDYGFLPGTFNIDSGVRRFKVYYRCSAFKQEMSSSQDQNSGSRVSMEMQFGNDKGGDLGIVTWTQGPASKDITTVKFEGIASFLAKNTVVNDSAAILNGVTDYESLCTNAYKSIEVHRPAIVEYLMKRDIKSMQRLYAAAKFIPGPLGTFSEGMEITLDLSQHENGMARAGAVCLIGGMVVEKISHGVIRSKVINHMLEKSCAGVTTAVGALGHHEEVSEESGKTPLFFTGVLKDSKTSSYYFTRKAGDKRVTSSEPVFVILNLAYLEKEETVKNIFFDQWR
ncbi:MAG TPA: hypothetical protein DCL44_06740 [Elusimicrobia bacterium]|nr:hypothetical protein [Elusimicrobiota bacterium]